MGEHVSALPPQAQKKKRPPNGASSMIKRPSIFVELFDIGAYFRRRDAQIGGSVFDGKQASFHKFVGQFTSAFLTALFAPFKDSFSKSLAMTLTMAFAMSLAIFFA